MIVNPAGGTKKGLDILDKVKPLFQEANAELTILNTDYAGHAKDLANELDYSGYDGLCAIGGDGTMFEMVNGMLKRDDQDTIPLGLITGGTGNAFMHDIDCLDPLEASSRILKGTVRQIDIAKVNAKNKLYYSFNIIGWGLVTDAGYLAEKLRWLGGMRYDVAAILEVLMGKRRIAQLLMDNEVIEDDFVFIIACNTIHTGKAMRIAPRARLDDGKIDLVIVRKSSKTKLLKLFPKLFSGEHIKSPLVEYRQVEKFSVIPKEDSSLNIDGELIGNTPIDVTMQPKMIEVLL